MASIMAVVTEIIQKENTIDKADLIKQVQAKTMASTDIVTGAIDELVKTSNDIDYVDSWVFINKEKKKT